MWRHHPWLLGLALAPLLFGSVTAEGQAAVGILFAFSLLLCSGQMGGASERGTAWRWGLLAFVLVLPLVPLPIGFVQTLDPQRAALAREFPVEAGEAPAWLVLTVSPARTMQRVWEIGLVIAAFCLARHGCRQPGFTRQLALVLAATLFLLAASDVWYRLDGRRSILGLWQVSWGKGAGTFANRNLFADWIVVGSVFCAGWLIRSFAPLRSARRGAMPAKSSGARWEALFVSLAIVFALGMAVLSGSRGGVVALGAGAVAGVALLARRSQRRRRWLALGLVAMAVFAVLVTLGEPLLQRMAAMKTDLLDRYPKLTIWQQSLSIVLKFPVFGAGWGSFNTIFNHAKTSGADYTVLHAENDYVQLLVEGGLLGALVCGGLLLRLLWRGAAFAWRERMEEPELVMSTLAALGAFAVHASFDFVGQIVSNSVLAAALLGFLTGSRVEPERPAVAPPPGRGRVALNLAAALALLTVALLQGAAFWQWHQGTRATNPAAQVEACRASLRLWPWATKRHVALVRAQAATFADLTRDRAVAPAQAAWAELNASLRRDPLNWELRLERAWLDLAFSTNAARARDEAWEVCRLMPLQPQVPLRFARQFIESDPDFTRHLLHSIRLEDARHLPLVFDVSWRLYHQAADLWNLTPDTPEGLLALGDFALEEKLLPLAAQAYQRIGPRFAPEKVAEKLLLAGRADLALAALPNPPATPSARIIAARAHLAQGQFGDAIRLAESTWRASPVEREIATPVAAPGTLEGQLGQWRGQPHNLLYARRVAEKVLLLPANERDLPLLRQLAVRFPGELRLRWILFDSERARGETEAAARAAIELAALTVRRG
jgi:O-antigen ligase